MWVQRVALCWPKELAESEETSASVSRGLFLAYMKNAHGGGGSRGGGVVSLERWLEDRQTAIKKVSRRDMRLLRSCRGAHEERSDDVIWVVFDGRAVIPALPAPPLDPV